MEHICQKNFDNLSYGDASIAENGCAVCCASMLLDKPLEDIIEVWDKRYWDDDFGTLPAAFDNVQQEFGLYLGECTEEDIVLSVGSVYLLLSDYEGKHYEIVDIISSKEARIHDPRVSRSTNVSLLDAKNRISSAEKIWKTFYVKEGIMSEETLTTEEQSMHIDESASAATPIPVMNDNNASTFYPHQSSCVENQSFCTTENVSSSDADSMDMHTDMPTGMPMDAPTGMPIDMPTPNMVGETSTESEPVPTPMMAAWINDADIPRSGFKHGFYEELAQQGYTKEQAQEMFDKTMKKIYKRCFIIVLIILGFITGIIPGIFNFIFGLIAGLVGGVIWLVQTIFGLVLLGLIGYGFYRIYNSDMAKRNRERAAQREAQKKAQKAARRAQGGMGLGSMLALGAMSSFVNYMSDDTYNGPTITPTKTNYDAAADARRQQAKQDAYWHDRQAERYANGSLQQQYHENAANAARRKF